MSTLNTILNKSSMKVIAVRVNKTEKYKFAAFIDEVNECPDTAAILEEGYYKDTLTIAAVGALAMEYTLRKVECTFNDYTITIIKE